MIKQAIIELQDTLEDIPPQAFNSLVVNTLSMQQSCFLCLVLEVDAPTCTLQLVCSLLSSHIEYEMKGHIFSQLCGIYQGQWLLYCQWHSSHTRLALKIHQLSHVQPFSTCGKTQLPFNHPHTLQQGR